MTETPEVQPPGANVPGYLLPLSILATLFCCLPAGIVAIIFSVQARSRSQAGDYPGASQAVRKANIWLIISVVLGIIVIALISSLGILGSLTDSSENKDNYSRPNSKNEQSVSRGKNEQ
jgi:heme/copper-type cytochrome/quinol oxidase subunit 2